MEALSVAVCRYGLLHIVCFKKDKSDRKSERKRAALSRNKLEHLTCNQDSKLASKINSR